MYSYEGPDQGVAHVDLKPEQKDKLREHLKREHRSALDERSGMEKKWKDWVKQAASRRERKDAKPRDSQIDMPLTAERIAQSKARLLNPIFQQDPVFVSKPKKPDRIDLARQVEEFVQYITDRFDLESVCDSWADQFHVFPVGVLKTAWVTEVEKVKKWTPLQDVDEYEAAREQGYPVVKRETQGGTRYFAEMESEYERRSGAFPEIVPIEDFIFPTCASDVQSAEWVTHRIWLTKGDLAYRIKKGLYEEKDGEHKILEELGKPKDSQKRLLDIHDLDGQENSTSKQHEIMETYICYDVDDDGEAEEIIVTWEKDSGLILRAVHNFYQSYHRPFVTHAFNPVEGFIYGIPLTFILEPLHAAYSASVNQRLDAASLANARLFLVPPGHPLKKLFDTEGLRTGVVESLHTSKEEILDFDVRQNFTQAPQLEQNLVFHADKLTGLSPDLSWGMQATDRPTATGDVSRIEEARQPQYIKLQRFRKSLATVILHMLSRYRQFYPEGVTYYIMEEDSDLLEMFFQWPDDVLEEEVIVETKVSSATMSKQLRKQEVVALMERIPQFYQILMQVSGLASQPGNPMSLIAVKLLQGLQVIFDQFMTEFEVAHKDLLNPDLVQEVQVVQQIMAQMQQLNSQLQNVSAQNAQLQNQVATLQGGPQMGGAPGPQPGVPGAPPMAGPTA